LNNSKACGDAVNLAHAAVSLILVWPRSQIRSRVVNPESSECLNGPEGSVRPAP
jgi:hypothetical protein